MITRTHFWTISVELQCTWEHQCTPSGVARSSSRAAYNATVSCRGKQESCWAYAFCTAKLHALCPQKSKAWWMDVLVSLCLRPRGYKSILHVLMWVYRQAHRHTITLSPPASPQHVQHASEQPRMSFGRWPLVHQIAKYQDTKTTSLITAAHVSPILSRVSHWPRKHHPAGQWSFLLQTGVDDMPRSDRRHLQSCKILHQVGRVSQSLRLLFSQAICLFFRRPACSCRPSHSVF